MAVPKKRHSKSRTKKRRAMWKKMPAPGLVVCPRCHEMKMPHRMCPECGFYKERLVKEVK